ncbi:MAG: hypothetical protein CL927_14805 [Deltaproteobacteria bacterium]|nr:hypothetical protein [Deltaproteobacteria bacterium]HCH61597.1 hypothetical protein [Deltaproteobacteria bacterium]
MSRIWASSLLLFSVVGCPPPEVLYGPEIFDEQASAADAPSLPGVAVVKSHPAVKQVRLRRPQTSKVGPDVEAVSAGSHVTFSGTVACDGCVEQLVLHVVGLGPSGEGPPLGTLAGGLGRTPLLSTVVEKGSFAVPVPRTTLPVAVELLVDTNTDRLPSVGERYALWLDPKVLMRADRDQSGITLDASDRPQGLEARARADGSPAGPARN